MKKYKITSLILAGALSLSLNGCGNVNTESKDENTGYTQYLEEIVLPEDQRIVEYDEETELYIVHEIYYCLPQTEIDENGIEMLTFPEGYESIILNGNTLGIKEERIELTEEKYKERYGSPLK